MSSKVKHLKDLEEEKGIGNSTNNRKSSRNKSSGANVLQITKNDSGSPSQ